MYLIVKRKNVVRIPPAKLGEDLDAVIEELAKAEFECKVDEERSFTLLITNIEKDGEGRVVHGDGAVYQPITYDALVFRVELQEIIQGIVNDVFKFGAFVNFGPFDGLLHISQLLDDRITLDSSGKRLVGKDTKRDLRVDDCVRARIVAVSINKRLPNESKIGLTMRQPGLGKLEWLEEDRKKREVGKKPEKKK